MNMPPRGPRIVALEEHFWTPALSTALRRYGGDDSVTTAVGELDQRLLDISTRRLDDMDESGVDMQVLSATTPATQVLTAAEAIPLARETNDRLAAAIAAHPDRFAGFATLPTPDPEAAARELVRAVNDLGLVGVMLFPRSGDAYIDDERFRPIFEAAAELGVPVYLHPQIVPKPVRDACYAGLGEQVELLLATAGWGWHSDAGLAALRLILAGTFDRHPHLQLVLGHWGEMLVSFLERADMLSNVATHLDRRVGEYITGQVHATSAGIFSHRMLQNTVAMLGVDRVLFSADYPYQLSPNGQARAFIESAPLAPEEKAKIGYRNAERLLGLRPGSAEIPAD